MLDLTTTFKTDYYELKMLDGTVLKLKRPTQGMMEQLMQLQGQDNIDALDGIMNVFAKVLCRNTDNVTFSREDIEADYDFTIAMFVIQDYFNYWNKDVEDKVNFLTSQQ